MPFPGYDKVTISWEGLFTVINTDSWKTALQNLKGVYLITAISNGKQYVGSATGDEMIWGRWKTNELILEREKWWKNALKTREFWYNRN